MKSLDDYHFDHFKDLKYSNLNSSNENFEIVSKIHPNLW